MLPLLSVALGFLALVGHAALWVGLVNRWHGAGFRRAVIKSVSLVFYAGLLVPLAALAYQIVQDRESWSPSALSENPLVAGYLALCVTCGLVTLALWAFRRVVSHHPHALVRELDRRVFDVERQLGYPPCLGLRTAVLRRVPGNQLWKIHVEQHEVRVPGLPPRLDGFSICHWSDLHLSGRIDRGYFREVVRLTNQLSADLLALTGDVCDCARHIDWVGELFGPARARAGKYYILGNHDLRTHDVPRLRQALAGAGFVDVGGRAITIDPWPIVVAGNERPWFADAPLDGAVQRIGGAVVRLLLAHSPDQLAWARRHRFDLMLAGHTHGGQVCFPLIGPVLCPSRHGTKYAAGFFHESPTLLHVSRGTASLFPVRLNCPPEITKLVLRPAAA
jgi:predicted MPP superfamily phosphohydrolase